MDNFTFNIRLKAYQTFKRRGWFLLGGWMRTNWESKLDAFIYPETDGFARRLPGKLCAVVYCSHSLKKTIIANQSEAILLCVQDRPQEVRRNSEDHNPRRISASVYKKIFPLKLWMPNIASTGPTSGINVSERNSPKELWGIIDLYFLLFKRFIDFLRGFPQECDWIKNTNIFVLFLL